MEKKLIYILPINFVVNDTLNYDQNTALGAAGGAAAAALQSGQSMSQGMMAALEEGGKGITEFFLEVLAVEMLVVWLQLVVHNIFQYKV